jgi:hypothetical protein
MSAQDPAPYRLNKLHIGNFFVFYIWDVNTVQVNILQMSVIGHFKANTSWLVQNLCRARSEAKSGGFAKSVPDQIKKIGRICNIAFQNFREHSFTIQTPTLTAPRKLSKNELYILYWRRQWANAAITELMVPQ